MSDIRKADREAAKRTGDDLLRSLAGYPTRAVHLGRDQIRHRTVIVQRDQFGNVIGSLEQIEELDHTSLDGDFID